MKICIVGGVAGGASAAARLRRLDEKFEIILFERDQHISFANCGLPYHISATIEDRDHLILWDEVSFKNRYNVDVRSLNEVISIDRQNKTINVLNKKTAQSYNESYDKLILSPGAKPFTPPIKGITSNDFFTLRNIEDMDKIISYIDEKNVKSALVIGGGFIGVELCENLHKLNIDTSMLEVSAQVMTPFDQEMANLLHNEICSNGVNLFLNKSIKEIKKTETKSDSIYKIFLNTGEEINADIILVAAGVRPENSLAKMASLEVGELGGIVVNEYLQTSDLDIFALGDAIEIKHFTHGKNVLIPLAGPANKQARIVANNIAANNIATNNIATNLQLQRYDSTLGTAIVKVFDLQAATTGLNEKTLNKMSIKYSVINIHPLNHAGYYPDAKQMTLKILYSEKSGEIFGAQGIGADGVDKRIDVISTLIKTKANIYQLKDIEFCYAPPYGLAKDPLNMIGTVADNVKNGLLRLINYQDILSLPTEKKDNLIFLDVRTKVEVDLGYIENAINIPLDDLRTTLKNNPNLLPNDKDKDIIIYCQVGIRAYSAYRILKSYGYDNIYSLSGGYKSYLQFLPFNTNKKVQSKISTCDYGESNMITTKTYQHQLDLTGLQCPGPIMRLKNKLDQINVGERVYAKASDIGFARDINAFCKNTGNVLIDVNSTCKLTEVIIEKGNPCNNTSNTNLNTMKKNTIIIFSNDLDKVLAAFVLANGARAMGNQVTLFFTFWGLNVLRKESISSYNGKTLLEKMFSFMMPKGSNRLILSKMHMMNMGTSLMKYIMKKKNVFSLEQMINDAKNSGVKMIACSMSMDIMGIKSHELMDGVEIGGVADYMYESASANGNLFI
ncbi:MAG: FAD-dependent oxidoreductase [Oligoflexia bacterium]|nr:FAD-dependent oxidoreductase [Oligoflexia bacterium]